MRQFFATLLLMFLVNSNCCDAEIKCASGQSIQIVTQDDSFDLELGNSKQGLEAKTESDIACKTVTSQSKNSMDMFSTIFSAMKQKANSHNDNLYKEIAANFETKVVQGRSDLKDEDEFNKLFEKLKQESLDEFDNRKLGDDEISINFRQKLLDDIDKLGSKLKSGATGTLALIALLGALAYAG